MKFLLIILIIATLILLLRAFRKPIIQRLMKLRTKLQLQSLRTAIHDADDNKEKTDRKTMVVFNTDSGKFEPIEKKLLKAAGRAGKNKNNAKLTEGRLKMKKKKNTGALDHDRVKLIEKKSLYVTR